MSHQEDTTPQPAGENSTEQLSSPVVGELLSESLEDADLERVVGGSGPDDSPQQEIIIFRKPV